jgi:indole-3-glycerol phosphate synthase
VQASVRWSPPQGALGTLLDSARERVRLLGHDTLRLTEAAGASAKRPRFGEALRGRGAVAVIAEIKRHSPSAGAIAPGLSASGQARAYAAGGASAISVLTEPSRFGGSLADLDAAAAAGLPLLRKDFIVDRLQLLEAIAHGASAALLIARALPPEQLAELYSEAVALGLEVLVEVHDDDELAAAVARGYSIIGVNNRNLESLEVDLSVTERLIPLVPTTTTAVYESGVRTRVDVERAARYGADAVLVGTALSSDGHPADRVHDLAGVPRRPRHGS